MGRHLILGAGNLGLDLSLQLKSQGHEVDILSKSLGEDFQDPRIIYQFIKHPSIKYEKVWCTVGAGGVSDCEKDFSRAISLHVNLPVYLAENLDPEAHLILFSTEYLGTEEGTGFYPVLSNYTRSKAMMEEAIRQLNRPKTRVVRVGSLYGTHKPKNTFPYKLIKASSISQNVKMALNHCNPTPTSWLAAHLSNFDFSKVDRHQVLEFFPSGPASTNEWGELILVNTGRNASVETFVNNTHPMKLRSRTDIPDAKPWWRLWIEYGPAMLSAIEREMKQ